MLFRLERCDHDPTSHHARRVFRCVFGDEHGSFTRYAASRSTEALARASDRTAACESRAGRTWMAGNDLAVVDVSAVAGRDVSWLQDATVCGDETGPAPGP